MVNAVAVVVVGLLVTVLHGFTGVVVVVVVAVVVGGGIE